MRALLTLPLFLLLTGICCAMMLVPAVLALSLEAFHDARAFFYSAVLGLILTGFFGLAVGGRPHNRNSMSQLRALLGAFVVLPVFLAVPFFEAVRTTTFLNAYFEMVSALTTTGATLFDPQRLTEAQHLWRAQVGWMGGLLIWVASAAILAPLALGGFEVTSLAEPGQGPTGSAAADRTDPARRVLRATQVLAPVYVVLTLILWLLLMICGDTPFVAISHAMSTMATSGISPVGGIQNGTAGIAGEMVIFCFMFFALSRLTFSGDTAGAARTGLRTDPEFRMGLIIVIGVPVLLFLRHWVAAFEVGKENIWAGIRSLWGGMFTVLSFLSTTGFESVDWVDVRLWSGLETPGMILMGLALIGGGVATTAGGVKLMRVYALYLNGAREIERLIHPSSVGHASEALRRIRREGAFIAWVFFMLVAMTIAGVTTILGLLDVEFTRSVLLAVASLCNTGPLITAAAETPIDLIAQTAPVKAVLMAAMILGRLEMLAIVVMLTPDAWRDA